MNIFDYITKDFSDEEKSNLLYFDEGGNAYFDTKILFGNDIANMIFGDALFEGDYIIIEAEKVKRWLEYQIIIDEDVDMPEYVRRPYYRLRGKLVTQEQAFDIIRRTDVYLGCNFEEIKKNEKFIHTGNFRNWLFIDQYGWIHADGLPGFFEECCVWYSCT